MDMIYPFLSGGPRGGFMLTGGASSEAGLSSDTKRYTTINWNAGRKTAIAFVARDNIRSLDDDDVAAASSEAKFMGAKVTQAILSGVAAASSEAKLIGSTLTPEDLSGGSRGHFIFVGWIKNDAIKRRQFLSKDLFVELLLQPMLVSSSEDFIGGLRFSTIVRLEAALLFLASFVLSKIAALRSFTKNSCGSIK